MSKIDELSLQKISWILSFRDIWQKMIRYLEKRYFLAYFLFLGDRLGLGCHLGNDVTRKMYIWVLPYSKMPFCHSGTKFHIFRLPSNIGLEMFNIFINSDAQYIREFQIAFNRWIDMFFGQKILHYACFVIPGHYGCSGGFLQKSLICKWDKKEEAL